jgi:conjugal transfer pilus assembly protein TrbC
VRSRLPLGLVLVLMGIAAGAQIRQPTEQEIEQAKRQYRQPTDAEVEAARQKYRMPSERELSGAAASQSPVNVDASPRPKGQVDVEALARSYEANRGAFETRGYASDQPALLVFVTLGMPEPTLRLLIDQAARTRAVLMLRGLQNASIRQTAARVQQLMGEASVEFQIDPQAFDRFGVRVAPTFVMVKAGAQVSDCAVGACVASDAFVSIAGDVSIDYALHAIAQRAPRFKSDAELFLRRMGG